MSYQSAITYKKALCQRVCPNCEDLIKIGDDILYCQEKKTWKHITCPWQNDPGYRPDMVIIDVENANKNYFTIKEHIENQKNDRKNQYESFEEQESGENPCGPGSSDSWHERLWIRIQELFGY